MSFICPGTGQTLQFPSCVQTAGSTAGHRHQWAAACAQGWSPLPSTELLQTDHRQRSPFRIHLHIFYHFRLCSISLNLLSWCENASLVFLVSLSFFGKMQRSSRETIPAHLTESSHYANMPVVMLDQREIKRYSRESYIYIYFFF